MFKVILLFSCEKARHGQAGCEKEVFEVGSNSFLVYVKYVGVLNVHENGHIVIAVGNTRHVKGALHTVNIFFHGYFSRFGLQ